MKVVIAILILAGSTLPACAQGLEAKTPLKKKVTHGDVTAWGVNAEWGRYSLPDPKASAVVHSADDLLRVKLWFRTDPDPGDPTGRPGVATPGLVINIEAAGGSIARESLRFFWEPKYEWKQGAYGKHTNFTPKNSAWAISRFSLVGELNDTYEVLKDGEIPWGDIYHARDHADLVPHPESMPAFLRFLAEIGKAGTGKVYWLVEPDQPVQNIQNVLLAWQPDGSACGGARVASPAWSRDYPLEAFEPREEVPSSGGPQSRTGLVPLPRGTWAILNRCRDGAIPLAIGKEGVVLQNGEGLGAEYEVHLLGGSGKEPGYIAPRRTRGFAAAPPSWTSKFDLWKISPAESRHFVGLAVCSPDVWKKVRSPAVNPPLYLRPLFADPELWACPPIK